MPVIATSLAFPMRTTKFSPKKPLGLFGGTFDPIHFGHLRLAEEAVDALNLAGVRWIPAGRPVLREAPQLSAQDRLAMVRLALGAHPRFELDPTEALAEQPSFTVPTLERLRRPEECGATRPLVLLIGADVFAGLQRWHRWTALFDLVHLAVAHRPGFPIDVARLPPELAEIYQARFSRQANVLANVSAGRIVSFPMTQLDISASKIRALLGQQQSARFLLPDALLSYIQDHHFYTENASPHENQPA